MTGETQDPVPSRAASRASHHQRPPRSGANVTGGWLVKPLMRRGTMGRPAAPTLPVSGSSSGDLAVALGLGGVLPAAGCCLLA